MLRLEIPKSEFFDNSNQSFVYVEAQTIQMEHSLVSISKWESKWHKPFLGKEQKTDEEIFDYMKCMIISPKVDGNTLMALKTNQDLIKQVADYINDPMTATWINDKDKPPSRRIITSELIYCWMFALNIPLDCEKWHLNRLLILIQVCNIENQPKKKMSQSDLYKRNNSLNAARRAQMNSRG